MIQTLTLRRSPFLTIAVVSTEVLRSQEEWEAVDSLQPETGNHKNGTISVQAAVNSKPLSTCTAYVYVPLGLGDRIPECYFSCVTQNLFPHLTLMTF